MKHPAINENDLVDFIAVDIDHKKDKKDHVLVMHIFVKKRDKPMYVDFTQMKPPTVDKPTWLCNIDVSHKYESNDNEVKGFAEVKIEGEEYWLYILKKDVPKLGRRVLPTFIPTLLINGNAPRRHNGTNHAP